MVDLPSGTVTFLFTDIGCSSRHWEEHLEAMRAATKTDRPRWWAQMARYETGLRNLSQT